MNHRDRRRQRTHASRIASSESCTRYCAAALAASSSSASSCCRFCCACTTSARSRHPRRAIPPSSTRNSATIAAWLPPRRTTASRRMLRSRSPLAPSSWRGSRTSTPNRSSARSTFRWLSTPHTRANCIFAVFAPRDSRLALSPFCTIGRPGIQATSRRFLRSRAREREREKERESSPDDLRRWDYLWSPRGSSILRSLPRWSGLRNVAGMSPADSGLKISPLSARDYPRHIPGTHGIFTFAKVPAECTNLIPMSHGWHAKSGRFEKYRVISRETFLPRRPENFTDLMAGDCNKGDSPI